MTPENIFFVYRTSFDQKDEPHSVMLAKFLLDNGNFEILENHGLPEDFEDHSVAEQANIIHRYSTSMYYKVVNLADMIAGKHPELMKDVDTKVAIDDDLKRLLGEKDSSPKSEDFEYDRVGGEGPRILSVSDGQVFLDGHLLAEDEINHVKENVTGGKAFLRRRMAKAESTFNEGMSPQMVRHLTEDSSIPGMGNLKSYNEYMKSSPKGIHVHVNMHDIRDLNRTHGPTVGTQTIHAVGHAIKDTARNLIGPDAKTFRLGGDKFSVHVPSTEGAALFARGLRQRLESIPAIRGTHNLAVSMGVGPSKEHAEWAMHDSTAERNRMGYKPGQSKTHVSVRVPDGYEGPVK